jgi:hypothetical protein
MIYRLVASYSPLSSSQSLVCYNLWVGTSSPIFSATFLLDKTDDKAYLLSDIQGKRQINKLRPSTTWEDVLKNIGDDRMIEFPKQAAIGLYAQLNKFRMTVALENEIASEERVIEESFAELIQVSSPNSATS